MACCSNNKRNNKNNKNAYNKIELEASRLSLEERKYYRDLFIQHSENDFVSKEKFPELLGLLGTDISVNFAMRIFDIFSQDGVKIKLEDYLKYVDVYHHGNERERCLTTFRLMDQNKNNKVDLKEFESYIELIIGAIKKVHPRVEDDVLTNKDIKTLFNKISNNKEFFNYNNFENVYFNKPQLLSWIDYFKNNDSSFLINLDRNIKVLLVLLERFNENMSNLFHNIVQKNTNTFNFKDAISEINKFAKAVDKIKKHFIKANSDFNIRNFFTENLQDEDKTLNINNLKAAKEKFMRTTMNESEQSGFSFDRPKDNYIRTQTMNPNFIKEQFSKLKHTINDEDYIEENKESPIENIVIQEEENENSRSNIIDLRRVFTSAKTINLTSADNSFIDSLIKDVATEDGLDKQKIKSLEEINNDRSLMHLNQDVNNLINFKSKNKILNNRDINRNKINRNNITITLNSNLKLNNTSNTINIELEKSNFEIKKFVSKIIELFDNNLVIFKWLNSSYKWIEDKYLNPVIMKGKKKERKKDKIVNKPISEKIHKWKKSSKENMLKLTDENFALLLNMIMGIQFSVNATSNFNLTGESELSQYLQSCKYSLPSANFNSAQLEGIFYIVTYGSVLFHNIRKIYGIDKELFIQSLSPQDFVTEMLISSSSIIEELFSTSKSGSLFYHTRDGKYILKTISKKEYNCLKSILPNYFKHILNNKYTLLPKFYGCYKLVRKIKKTKMRFYFLVMDNVFMTSREIQIKYDLKGSKIGREVLNKLSEEERKQEKFAFALKDLDLDKQNKKFIIGDKKDSLINQIKIDSDFLRMNKIVDYSLLIGIHKVDEAKKIIDEVKKHHNDVKCVLRRPATNWRSDTHLKQYCLSNKSSRPENINIQTRRPKRFNSNTEEEIKSVMRNTLDDPSLFTKRQAETNPQVQNLQNQNNSLDESNNSLLAYSVSTDELCSESEYSSIDALELNHPFIDHHDGGLNSKEGKEIYYVGIIDILIQFNTLKKIEFVSKLVYNCSSKMSVVPPDKYRHRFIDYISTIFHKE